MAFPAMRRIGLPPAPPSTECTTIAGEWKRVVHVLYYCRDDIGLACLILCP